MTKKKKQEVVVEEPIATTTTVKEKPVKKNDWEIKDRTYLLKGKTEQHPQQLEGYENHVKTW